MTIALEGLARQNAGEMLVGTVERVTFHNPDTGFCVLRVQVRGRRDLTTVVGQAAASVLHGEGRGEGGPIPRC